MSPHWLKFLEKFGGGSTSSEMFMEEEDLEWSLDDPSMFERYDVLFHLYGPLPDSIWEPYHCPTLFASIDKGQIAAKKLDELPLYEQDHPDGAFQWLDEQTMVVVDLNGGKTIEMGVVLMKQQAQFVSTFDHWARPRLNQGAMVAIDASPIIDTMYTLGPEVHKMRQQLDDSASPVWLCDKRRHAGAEPSPGTFDNRYFIDDSILPGVETLKKGGIRNVVHLGEKFRHDPEPDLTPFFIDAHKAGLTIQKVGLDDKESWVRPRSFEQLPFETDLPVRSFKKTDMGGYGRMVPQPSEGGYSSGGVGG